MRLSQLVDVRGETRRVSDVLDELQVSRLKELDDGPNSDVLEGSIGTAEEAIEIGMQATVGLVPNVVKWRVVVRGRTSIYRGWAISFVIRKRSQAVAPLDDRLPKAAALLP